MIRAEDVAERLATVRDRIARAGGTGVSVVAVTKTFGIDAVHAAAAAGCDAVGENYAQELTSKLGRRGRPATCALHRPVADEQGARGGTVRRCVRDRRPGLARRPNSPSGCRAPRCWCRCSTDGDLDKGGCSLADAPGLVEMCRSLDLVVDGLMTVGPTDGGPHAARSGFRAVRALLDRLGLTVCSMGMTDDLEVAVQEGSTQVRVGQRAVRSSRPRRSTWLHLTSSDSASLPHAGGEEMSMWKRAMDYLGLGPDDAYDDYDLPPEPEPRGQRGRQPRYEEPAVRGGRPAPEYEPEAAVRTVPTRPSFPSTRRRACRPPTGAGHRRLQRASAADQPHPLHAPRREEARR